MDVDASWIGMGTAAGNQNCSDDNTVARGCNLLMDYTWRQKGDANSFPFNRMK